jgi:hypothetical protein
MMIECGVVMKHWTIGNLARRRADLGLKDDTVSALHASLTQTDDGRWMLEDRNSTNGTARFVNGQWTRIRQAQVGMDDRLRFGRAETTVRQLLQSSIQVAPEPPRSDVLPWTDDLTAAFGKVRDFSELKKNVLFIVDLIADPGQYIMRCAVRRQPVNPFSFMLFGGLLYNLITTSGLTISSLDKPTSPSWVVSLMDKFQENLPLSLIIFTLMLIYNIFPFIVFKYFSLKVRYFDDFMRLMAVVQGMFWMLGSFLFLFVNEAVKQIEKQSEAQHSEMSFHDAVYIICAYVLGAVTVIYLLYFSIVAQKHFWRISYGRTLWCYILTMMAFVVVTLLMFSPIIWVAVRQNGFE